MCKEFFHYTEILRMSLFASLARRNENLGFGDKNSSKYIIKAAKISVFGEKFSFDVFGQFSNFFIFCFSERVEYNVRENLMELRDAREDTENNPEITKFIRLKFMPSHYYKLYRYNVFGRV